MSLIGSIRAEAIRQRHSWFTPILLTITFVGVLLFLAYFAVTPYESWYKVTGYLQVIGGILPLVVGLVCGFISEREFRAGNYTALLGLPSRRLALAGILTYLELLYALVCAVAICLFALGMGLLGQNPMGVGSWLLVFLGLVLGGAALIPLTMVVAMAWGRQVGILVGVFGSLMGFLLQTGLGDGIWWFLLPALSSRLPVGVAALVQATQTRGADQTVLAAFNTQQNLGWGMGILLTCASWVLAMIWVSACRPGHERNE